MSQRVRPRPVSCRPVFENQLESAVCRAWRPPCLAAALSPPGARARLPQSTAGRTQDPSLPETGQSGSAEHAADHAPRMDRAAGRGTAPRRPRPAIPAFGQVLLPSQHGPPRTSTRVGSTAAVTRFVEAVGPTRCGAGGDRSLATFMPRAGELPCHGVPFTPRPPPLGQDQCFNFGASRFPTGVSLLDGKRVFRVPQLVSMT